MLISWFYSQSFLSDFVANSLWAGLQKVALIPKDVSRTDVPVSHCEIYFIREEL